MRVVWLPKCNRKLNVSGTNWHLLRANYTRGYPNTFLNEAWLKSGHNPVQWKVKFHIQTVYKKKTWGLILGMVVHTFNLHSRGSQISMSLKLTSSSTQGFQPTKTTQWDSVFRKQDKKHELKIKFGKEDIHILIRDNVQVGGNSLNSTKVLYMDRVR